MIGEMSAHGGLKIISMGSGPIVPEILGNGWRDFTGKLHI